MTLEDLLAEQRQAAFARRSPQERFIRAADVDDVEKSGLSDRALGVGESMPAITLPDATGNLVDVSSLLRNGPVVLSFYRGGWCPYCNIELRALQKYVPEFTALSATLVAISPEQPDASLDSAQKNELTFPVLSDHANTVAHAFRLVHPIGPGVVAYQRGNGVDAAAINGVDQAEVPLPATYVVDTDGRVVFAAVSADYTKRAEPQDVLAAVRSVRLPPTGERSSAPRQPSTAEHRQ